MVKPISEKFSGKNFPEELANLPLLGIPEGREYLIYNCVAKVVRIYNNLFGADLIAYSTPKNQAIHVETKQGGKFNFLVHLQSIRRKFNFEQTPSEGTLGDVLHGYMDESDFYVASELLHDFFHQILDPSQIVSYYTKKSQGKDPNLEEFFIFTYFGDESLATTYLKDAILDYRYNKNSVLSRTKYPEFYRLVDVATKRYAQNSREVPEELTNYVKKLYKISYKVFDTELESKLERFSALAIEAVKEMEKKATKLPKLEDTFEIPKKVPLKDIPQFILELKHVRNIYKGKQS